MRTGHILLCASALLLATGALAAGCISNKSTPPEAGDSGLVFGDASFPSFDASSPFDASTSFDATLDALDAAATATLSTTPVDFGLVACGTGTGSKTYSFTNTGPVPITYSTSVTSGSVFAVEGTGAGSVAPGQSASLTLDVSSIPTTSTAGTPITGTLTVTTNVPGFSSVAVPLTVTPQGGSLTLAPALAGFGQVQLATPGDPISLTIGNVGNAPVSITIGPVTGSDGGADPEFGVVYAGSPAAVTLAPGETLADAGATFTPTTAGVKSVVAEIQTSDPLCASAASSIAMSGTGTPAQITVGPDPLQFGTVNCGATGAALQVKIKNASPMSATFTDALTLGTANSPFVIDTAGGTLPAAGADGGPSEVIINVTPKKILIPGSVVPGGYDDTLVVTPSAPGVAPTTIALEESAAGAILVVGMANTAYGTVLNTAKSLPFTVTNSGNRSASVTVGATGVGYTAALTSSATAAADGGVATGNLTFVPSSNGADNGSLTVTTTDVLCSAAPAATPVTATGAVPVASFPATTIALDATCGNGATPQATLTVTNTGKSSMTLSGVASKNSKFTVVSVAPTTVAANGGTGVITIRAATINTGIAGGTTLNDTLSFTTNEVGSPTHTVPVTVLVNGANLSFVGGTQITFTDAACGLSYSVTNTGNMSANVSATGQYPNVSDTLGDPGVFAFGGTFSTAQLIAVGAPVSDTVGYGAVCGITTSPCALAGTQAFSTVNTTTGSAVGICIPLPTLNLLMSFDACNDCC